VSLTASLEEDSQISNSSEQFDFETETGTTDHFNHAFEYKVDNEVLFVCPVGGRVGGESLMQQLEARRKLQTRLQEISTKCDKIVKDSNTEPKDLPEQEQTGWDSFWNKTGNGSEVISGIWSKHDNEKEDRIFKIAFSSVDGISLGVPHVVPHDEFLLSQLDQFIAPECAEGEVMTGLASDHIDEKEDRVFKIVCREVMGSSSELKKDRMWEDEIANDWDQPFSYNPLRSKFIVGFLSIHDNHREDRRFQFKTQEFCKDRSDEIEDLGNRIQEINEKINSIHTSETSCSLDLPLPVNQLRELSVSYSSNMEAKATARTKCNLLHLGEPPQNEGFSLTSSQLTEIVRGNLYHASTAASHKEGHFLSTAEKPEHAMKVGFFALVDHGKAL
jgi:hypothetical protein